MIPIIAALVIAITVAFNWESSNETNKTYLNSSWSYSYADVDDLSNNSDIIALIKVGSIADSETVDSIPFTTFNVQVENAIYGCENNEELKIYMTGFVGDNEIQEVIDDPLLVEGDEFLIFAKRNSDGTCTILSGPQGRLKYQDGEVSSLKYVYKNVKDSNDFFPIDVDKKDINSIIREIKKSDKFH